LEPGFVLKANIDHLVHFQFQLQQLLCKVNRVVEVLLILDDLVTPRLDVWYHLFNDQVERLLISFKYVKHQAKFFQATVLKHVVTAS
jgi:hypothetical protein